MEETELNARQRVDLWRQKQLAGTLTNEELAEAVRVIRGDRITAGASKPRAKAPAKTEAELLDELDNL